MPARTQKELGGGGSSESFLEHLAMLQTLLLAGMDPFTGSPATGLLSQKLHPRLCPLSGSSRVGLWAPGPASFLLGGEGKVPFLAGMPNVYEGLWNTLHYHGSNFSAQTDRAILTRLQSASPLFPHKSRVCVYVFV